MARLRIAFKMRASAVAHIFEPHRVKPVQGPEYAIRVPPVFRMLRKMGNFPIGNAGGVTWHSALA
jgi:hypothetical protein